MITVGALLPHPPIVVPGIGQPDDLAKVDATITALKEVDQMLAADPPETLLVFTPHGVLYRDAIIIYGDKTLSGGLQRFGLDKTWSWENDLDLAEKIIELGQESGLPVYLADQVTTGRNPMQAGLDHGVLVPFSFFNPAWSTKVKLIVIPLSYLPLEELYQFGAVIKEAVARLGRKVAVIASGDLSHCLKPGAPVEYNPRGEEFDHTIIELLTKQAVKEFFCLDPVLIEKAAECGFRSLIMLLGTFDETEYHAQVHSYEGPFGVGYAVASLKPIAKRTSLVKEFFESRQKRIMQGRSTETPLVKYARNVVESFVKGESLVEPGGLETFSTEQAGVFVSIKSHGELRGCIGTIGPTQKNIISEVKQNAISAATKDPRFEAIEEEELEQLVYSVDVLKPAEPIQNISELDPEKYGVIVSQGYRRGLLLPNLEGVETAAEQVAIAKQKAGIKEDEAVELERFEVVRYY